MNEYANPVVESAETPAEHAEPTQDVAETTGTEVQAGEDTCADAMPSIVSPIDADRRKEILDDQQAWLTDRGGYNDAEVGEDVAALEVGVRTRTENPETKSGWSNAKTSMTFALDGKTEDDVDSSFAWLARYGLGGIMNKLTIALRKVDGTELDAGQVIRESELLAFFDVDSMAALIKHIAPWETKSRKKASARTEMALAACAVDDQREERLAMASGELAAFMRSILKTPALQLTAPEQAAQLKAYKFLVSFIGANKMKGSKPKSKVLAMTLKNMKALTSMLRNTIADAQEKNVDPATLTGKIDTLETLDFLLCGGDQLSIELADFEAAAEAKRKKKAEAEGGATEDTYVDLVSSL